ncbi:MAG: carboxypeptidase-like regulatory domain-containing protein [Cyclobacteriaceae bacterium]
MKRLFLLVIMVFLAGYAMSQRRPSNPILLTGVVMEADQQKPLPYVNIQLNNTIYGTASDSNGYFSIFVNPGDTLRFSSIGYQTAYFVMPYTVSNNRYSLIQLLRQETILLSEVVIFPGPSIDQFKEAFLDAELPVTEEDLVREVQREVRQDMNEFELNEYEADQKRYQRLYELNEIFPPNNFLNPMRWSDFVRSVRGSKDE